MRFTITAVIAFIMYTNVAVLAVPTPIPRAGAKPSGLALPSVPHARHHHHHHSHHKQHTHAGGKARQKRDLQQIEARSDHHGNHHHKHHHKHPKKAGRSVKGAHKRELQQLEARGMKAAPAARVPKSTPIYHHHHQRTHSNALGKAKVGNSTIKPRDLDIESLD